MTVIGTDFESPRTPASRAGLAPARAPAVPPCACCGMIARPGAHLCTREVLLALGEALEVGAI